MNGSDLEHNLRTTLRALGEALVPDREPPELVSALSAPAVRHRHPGRFLVAAALVLLAIASVLVVRRDDRQHVDTTDTPTSTTTTIPQPAGAPDGAMLLAVVDTTPTSRFELWAARDTGDSKQCFVDTTVRDGVRRLGGWTCSLMPYCLDEGWLTFAPLGDTTSESDLPSLCRTDLEPARPEVLSDDDTMSEVFISGVDSPPDANVMVQAFLAENVATWEITTETGNTYGPSAPITLPDDPSQSQLFTLIPPGAGDFTVTARSADGTILATKQVCDLDGC